MPPRPFSLRLAGRQNSICQSCLLRLRYSAPTAWPARYYSKAGRPEQAQRLQRPPPASPSAGAPPGELPVVRYFEQDDSGKRRQLRNIDEFNEALNEGVDEEVEARIKELEDKVRDAAGLIKYVEKYGGKRLANKLKRQYKLAQEEETIDTEEDGDATGFPRIPVDVVSKGQRQRIGQLNAHLKLVHKKEITTEVVGSTWKHYSAARMALSTEWKSVPPEVWELLWRILSPEVKGVTNRMHHILAVSKDMQAAGVVLDDKQQLLAVEAMFIQGWEKEAIDNWKKLVTALGSRPETAHDYWALGVRMCSLFGDLERAERAANMLFESSPDADPRILIPFIRACARDEATQDKSWAAYRRLRAALGSSMTIDDYDEVISCFLSSNRTEHGLHAFVDMMFSGAVDLENKTRLPSMIGNHFFLGKWLKRLIGAGDLDGAFNVLKFMQDKGIMAASVQVNGLIGAWMRSGIAENLQRAEDLAWAMIRSRQVYVDLRRRNELLEWPLKLKASSASQGPTHAAESTSPQTPEGELTFVPRATLETFSLLAENYQNRGLHQRLEELWLVFTDAEISTNAFLVNQLLDSYIQQGHAEKAREFYDTLRKEHGLAPDAHTFLALFRTLPVNHLFVVHPETRDASVRPCRQIFRDMVQSPWAFHAEWVADRLPRMVLHSFRRLEDHVGLLVALRAMRKLFDFVPSEPLLLEMAAGTQALKSPSTNQRRLLSANRRIESLLRQRVTQVQAEGGTLANMTPERKVEELTLVLEQLFWPGKADLSEEEFQAVFRAVADEMGVYDVVVLEDEKAITKGYKPSLIKAVDTHAR